MQIFKNKTFLIHLFFALYCLVTLASNFVLSGWLAYIPSMMAWNLFLALLAYDFAFVLVKFQSRLIQICSAILAFLFYPNTFYMLTDAKHIAEWFSYSGNTFQNSQETIGIMIMLLGIIFAVFLGIGAMNLVLSRFFKNFWKRLVFVFIMSFLSSVAIYAGRISDLRLNSWYIFTRPIDTIQKLFSVIHPSHTVFLVSFTASQLFLIVLANLFFRKDNINEN